MPQLRHRIAYAPGQRAQRAALRTWGLGTLWGLETLNARAQGRGGVQGGGHRVQVERLKRDAVCGRGEQRAQIAQAAKSQPRAGGLARLLLQPLAVLLQQQTVAQMQGVLFRHCWQLYNN